MTDIRDEPIFVTAYEDGTWVPWQEWQKLPYYVKNHHGKRVHAIMYEDGRVWDAVNGLRRSPEFDYTPEMMQQCFDVWKECLEVKERRDGDQQVMFGMRRQPEVFGEIE